MMHFQKIVDTTWIKKWNQQKKKKMEKWKVKNYGRRKRTLEIKI